MPPRLSIHALLLAALATGFVAMPLGAQKRGYTLGMITELVKNGASDDRVAALVGSACLERALTANDGADLKTVGAKADLIAKVTRACVVGTATVASNPSAPPAAATEPPTSASPVTQYSSPAATTGTTGTGAAVGSAADAAGAAGAASAAGMAGAALGGAANAAAAVAPASGGSGGSVRPGAPPAVNEKAASAAAYAAARDAIPRQFTTEFAQLGATRVWVETFECPKLNATTEPYFGSTDSSFDSRLTRYICAKLKFASTQPTVAGQPIQFSCKFDQEGGTLGEQVVDGSPLYSGRNEWETYVQWGYDDYDRWKNGRYSVICEYNLKPVVRAPFRIFTSGNQGTDLTALKARVLAFRTYATDNTLFKGKPRYFSDVFQADRVRWIGMELQLVFPTTSAEVTEVVACTWRNADTVAPMQVDTLRVNVIAGDNGVLTKLSGRGFEEAGGWATGDYSIDCLNGDRRIAQTKFRLK